MRLAGTGRRAYVAIIGIVVIAASAMSLTFARSQSSDVIRMRATAIIEVDGVERTGSAVQEFQLQWVNQPQIGRTGAWRVLSRGEAISVNVPDQEPIYVLMTLSNSNGDYGFLVESQCTNRTDGTEAQRESFTDLGHCEFDLFPKAIRFADHASFGVAEAVHMNGEDRNGYRFLIMTLERTDDPVTQGAIPEGLLAAIQTPGKVPFDEFVSTVGYFSFKQDDFR